MEAGTKAKKSKLEIKTERPTRNGVPVYTMEELVAEMKRLGPENEPELVDWGPDVGAEIIDDEYSRGEITLDDILSGRASKGR
ncbi:MAG TPA: hypothetical protein VF601_08055 [Beijerinckiaceae bacterium]|jgi:antitoxin MazE